MGELYGSLVILLKVNCLRHKHEEELANGKCVFHPCVNIYVNFVKLQHAP